MRPPRPHQQFPKTDDDSKGETTKKPPTAVGLVNSDMETQTHPFISQKALCKLSSVSSSIIITGNVNSKLKRPQKWWKEMTSATLHVPISLINVTFKLSLSSLSQRPRVFKPWCDTNVSVWQLQLHWLSVAPRLQCLRLSETWLLRPDTTAGASCLAPPGASFSLFWKSGK